MTARHPEADQAAGPAPAADADLATPANPVDPLDPVDPAPAGRSDDGGGGDRPAVRVGRAAGRAAGHAAAQAARGTRRAIRRNPTADRAYRVTVGAVGGTTVALGVVLIPTPGPGALVTLGGLGILATEFEGAKKVSRRANAAARRAYHAAKEAKQAREARQTQEARHGRADGPGDPGTT